jgi:hypothetical protein
MLTNIQFHIRAPSLSAEYEAQFHIDGLRADYIKKQPFLQGTAQFGKISSSLSSSPLSMNCVSAS